MTPVLAIVAIAVLIWMFIRIARAPVAPSTRATVAQIASVFDSLSAASAEPAFVVISFNTPGRPRVEEAVDLQFYKENGRVGFDWALEAARNVQDEELFLSFARTAGFEPRLMETNGVRHHRVDDGDVLHLCTAVIQELYGRPPDSPVDLIMEGFELKA
jgi:hypothetical protein